MVEWFRDVADTCTCLTNPQHELKLMEPVVNGVEPNPCRQFATHRKQVADVHGAAKVFWRPFGLKEWLNQLARSLFELVFVRVSRVELRRKVFSDGGKRFLMQ